MSRYFIVFLCIFVVALPLKEAASQASLDLRGDVGGSGIPGGSIIPGYDSATCDGTIEGAIRYNSATSAVEFCNGSNWGAPGGGGSGGCTAPASCPNVGDVCSDGSIFAGFMDYSVYGGGSCEPLYVTDNNQSTSSSWSASYNNDIADPSDKRDAVDGQYNRDNRGGGTFPAFELCENNTYHGKSDWYLPARVELNLLWLNQAAIDANAAGNFTTDTYWSSTEEISITATVQNFGTGNQNGDIKDIDYDVRCVRRD